MDKDEKYPKADPVTESAKRIACIVRIGSSKNSQSLLITLVTVMQLLPIKCLTSKK